MKFIDLFAGLGGFHLALRDLGHECVFASEIDNHLRELYEKNFNIPAYGDITKIDEHDIPVHDILCAGFPCQPFSKAGSQEGFNYPDEGDMFNHVMRIVKRHHPTYIILENVPNIRKHDNGRTWKKIEYDLAQTGYEVKDEKFSPHQFEVPQIRERLFVVAKLKSAGGLEDFRWPEKTAFKPDIRSILDVQPEDGKPITEHVNRCLQMWQRFIQRYPSDEHLPTFPIWTMEFGANYPYDETTPFSVGTEVLGRFRGSHGVQLAVIPVNDRMRFLPAYARTNQEKFPRWKINFIRQNRELYQKHRLWIDEWMAELSEYPPSLQKFEWNYKGGERDIWKYIIQFRASGVRVKAPTTSPSLVAMTTTQVPIIAWEKRYMTPRECARLQSMDELTYLPNSPTKAFKALGNAVNVKIVARIACALFTQGNERSNTQLELSLFDNFVNS